MRSNNRHALSMDAFMDSKDQHVIAGNCGCGWSRLRVANPPTEEGISAAHDDIVRAHRQHAPAKPSTEASGFTSVGQIAGASTVGKKRTAGDK